MGIYDKEFFVGDKICNYYSVFIIENGYKDKQMVKEDDIEGFIQCLKYFGYYEC